MYARLLSLLHEFVAPFSRAPTPAQVSFAASKHSRRAFYLPYR
jgi:hypothetical protein